MKKEHLEIITLRAEQITNEHGLELVDVQFNKEGGVWFLRVYIDNTQGEITTDECAVVNRNLSKYLDEIDPIEQQYFLEVSSPGIERQLKKPEDFSRFKGHLVRVNTYTKIDGRKVFIGTLNELESGSLKIIDEDTDEEISLSYDNVANVKLSIKF